MTLLLKPHLNPLEVVDVENYANQGNNNKDRVKQRIVCISVEQSGYNPDDGVNTAQHFIHKKCTRDQLFKQSRNKARADQLIDVR